VGLSNFKNLFSSLKTMSFLEKLTGPISREQDKNKIMPDSKGTEDESKNIDWTPS